MSPGHREFEEIPQNMSRMVNQISAGAKVYQGLLSSLKFCMFGISVSGTEFLSGLSHSFSKSQWLDKI